MRGGEEGGVGPSFVNRADLADTASGRCEATAMPAWHTGELKHLPQPIALWFTKKASGKWKSVLTISGVASGHAARHRAKKRRSIALR